MRGVVLGLTAVALVGCGQARDAGEVASENITAADTESGFDAPAGIAITAAPGVAFAYRYAFRLPSAKIASAQEGHAAACEKLGVARCRITGMRYRLIGENDIDAMLSFKLDPAIARAFGKNGIALIKAADGTLTEAAITGTDAGGAIDRLTTEQAQAADALRRVEADLARTVGPRAAVERAELQNQRAAIERTLAANRGSVADQRESLANTPMTFDYGSGRAVRGFDSSAPLTSALDTAVASAQATLAVLLGILAIFGPPAIVLLLAWLLWRRFGRLAPWRRGSAPAT